ncbi:MAG: hypothetical protein AAFR31_18850 [Cyanobacteria bacterium J06627_8]
MQPTLDDEKTKELLAEVLTEMLHQKKGVFYDLILGALEEIGLSNAILEGEASEIIDEREILDILQAES